MRFCSEEKKRSRLYRRFWRKGVARPLTSWVDGALGLRKSRSFTSENGSPRSQDAQTRARYNDGVTGGAMTAPHGKAKRSIRRRPTTSATVRTGQCAIVAVAKRRDGGTPYSCLNPRANATAKYGRRARACRAAHLEPETGDVFELDLDIYRGPVALWGAVPAVYDTTRLEVDRGIHLHARKSAHDKKEIDATFS